jgi:DNA-binding transcriptional regulator YhcF (GntR family)
MTALDLIRNCVLQYRRPFDAALIARLTGVDIEAVQHIFTDLESAGQIKCITSTESIYIRANRYTQPSSPDDLPWAVYPEKAIPLLDLIERQSFSNGRKMAMALGMSHQWVYVYLKAMVSAGIVRNTQGKYRVIRHSKLKQLGEAYRRGVLRKKTGRQENYKQHKRQGAARRN